MGKLLELAARVRTAVKLKRGQCDNCFTPLRDDATSRYCTDQCETEYRLDMIV